MTDAAAMQALESKSLILILAAIAEHGDMTYEVILFTRTWPDITFWQPQQGPGGMRQGCAAPTTALQSFQPDGL